MHSHNPGCWFRECARVTETKIITEAMMWQPSSQRTFSTTMEIIATRSSMSCICLGVTHILSSMWVFILKQTDYYGNVYKYTHMEWIHSLHKCSLLYQTKLPFICIHESPRKGAEEPCEGSWAGFAAGKCSHAPDVFLFCLSVDADQEWTTLVHAWLKLRLFPLVDMWGKQR